MPDWRPAIRERLAPLRLEPTHEAEIVAELADHLEDRYQELVARGAEEEEAFRGALAELADAQALVDGLRPSETPTAREPERTGARPAIQLAAELLRDLRFAGRTLRKAKGFALAVTLTLGLGIGVNTAAFTLINSLLLDPLPAFDASGLLSLHTVETHAAQGAPVLLPLSFPNLQDVGERGRVFRSLAGFSSVNALTWMNGTSPERLFAELVTANYFETLGVSPRLGRFFVPDEGRAPGAPVLVLGYAPWQHRFGAASDIVGRRLVLNGTAFTVIGIAPEGFRGVTAVFGPDLWIPAAMAEQVLPAQQRGALHDREALLFRGAARLAPGASHAQAEASLEVIASQLEREHPDANRGRRLALRPLAEASWTGFSRQAAVAGGAALMGVVAMVLLICCSNVANLLLARASGRRQELALRLALGASRGRLLRQLLSEAVLLALAAGALGTLFGYAGTRLLGSFVPSDVALNFVELRLDGRVLAFTLVVSVLTGLAFSLAPAWQAARVDVARGLSEDARSAGASRGSQRLRKLLLVGQVALSLVALVTAGLFVRSIERAYAIDPGFDTERTGILLVSPGQAGYDRARSEQFYRDVRARVAVQPGVESLSWATNLPFFARFSRGVLVEGDERAPDARGALTLVNRIDLDYFATMGVPIESGRDFTDRDVDGSPPVAIVNESFAKRHWPGRDPLLGRFRFAGEERLRQVVGIARDANYTALGEAPQPCVYLPLRQDFADSVVLYVRSRGEPGDALAAAQREVRSIDPLLWTRDVRTMATVVDQALFAPRIGASLLGVFGLLALALASIGLYGVMAHAVDLRRRELGVRMALGANARLVARLVLRQGLGLVATGIGLGLLGALVAGRALSGLLYGLSPADPVSLGGSAAILFLVAALACYVPARRASHVDPLVALREP